MPRSPAAPRRVRWRSAVVVGLLVLALTPSRGATQVVGIAALGSPLDSALARARRLVNEGAGAVGRSVVDSVLAAVTPGSPDEARVLLWRAMLAESWDAAEQDYLRLMLEFDGSALAGEAMLRLAQGELARGDRPAALRYLERIVRETPTAPVRAEATVWHGRLLLEQGEAATACPLLREGRARVPRDADDLLTRYEVLLISCANLEATATTTAAASATATATDRTPTASTEPTTATPARPATPPRDTTPAIPSVARAAEWTVQLGAYATRDQAAAVVRRLGTSIAGVRVDEVPGGPYPFKVRFGRFPSRSEAEAAGATHTRRTGATTFVTETPR